MYPAEVPASMNAVIAAQVENRRRARGWSQAQLADAIGASTSVVQQLETGGRTISVEELLLLAYTLNVSPADLIGATYLTDLKRLPLFGQRFSKREVKAWAQRGTPLRGMDERRYSEQVSDDDYLARKRVPGLEELERVVQQLNRAAYTGNEDQIDDCLRALEAQVGHVRHTFGRKRGAARVRPHGSGTVEVIRGDTTEGEGESHAN